MNRRKLNISRWYALGVAALLMAGCLLLAVGTTLARYRTDSEAEIIFKPRKPISVTLGKINEETGEFDSTAVIGWENQTDGSMLMNFAVSNQNQREKPLEVRVRLLGTLHAWSGENSESESTTEVTTPDATVALTDGTLLENDEEQVYTAEVMRIPENTALYYSFGDGWIFRFLDEDGEELTWLLEEGKLSCVEMNITISGETISGTSLLQLQVVAEQMD